MAQNLHELPPSKRFKHLNSQQMRLPLNALDENNPKSLPAKKRSEIRYSSSTSLCLPAKKRVWAPLPSTPTKTETHAQGKDPLVEEREKIRGGEAIHGVPVKKRLCARQSLSPINTENQARDTDQKHAEERGQTKDREETKCVPAKKRVWTLLPLFPTKPETEEEATNLKFAQEKDHIHEVKEVKEIYGIPAKMQICAPKPLSPTKTQTETHGTDPKHVEEKGVGEAIQKVKETHEIPVKKRVRARNLLSPTKTETEREGIDTKQVWVPHPLSLIKTEIQEGAHLKLAEEKAQIGYQIREVEVSAVARKRQIWLPEPLTPSKTQTQENTDPKPSDDKPQNEFQIMDEEDKIHEILSKEQVCAPNPLSSIKSQTQYKEKDPEFVEEGIQIEEETDDGVICAVCQSTDGDPSDPIVFCDGCDLMVHASCYGNPLIKSIPEGDWFCLACSSKTPKKEKRCCLCPVKGGALKPAVADKWAHVMCALLVPEVFFRDPEGRDGIDCSRVPHARWQKDCFLCGKNYGCAIDCAESKCKLGFHVSCGLEEGLCFEYREEKGGDIVAGFCAEHTKIWEKQQLTGKFKIVSRDQELKKKTV